jgi:hypothetical protein
VSETTEIVSIEEGAECVAAVARKSSGDALLAGGDEVDEGEA